MRENPEKSQKFACRGAADEVKMKEKMSALVDLWAFLKERKKWWLVPIVLVILILGLIILLGSSSAIAPFIYTIF